MNHEPPESGIRPMPMKPGRRWRRRCDADVAGRGERKPGARAGPVDRRDHRLLEASDQADVRVVRLLEPLADRAGQLLELLQVLAGAEAPAGAGDDDCANVRGGRLLERGPKGGMQRGVEGVEDLGPVERDRQDRAVARRQHLAHAASLKRQAKSARTRSIASGASR